MIHTDLFNCTEVILQEAYSETFSNLTFHPSVNEACISIPNRQRSYSNGYLDLSITVCSSNYYASYSAWIYNVLMIEVIVLIQERWNSEPLPSTDAKKTL